MRVAPPYLVGADGAHTEATLAVGGCAVDTNPAGPWGRPVTAPGAPSCTVRVRWNDRDVAYPAVLDPKWTTTGAMATARQDHSATLLSTGKVLVAGGRTLATSGSSIALSSSELFDPATKTWSPTGSMSLPTASPRWSHTATQLATGSNPNTSGKVLVAGGFNGSVSLATTQLYSVSAGTWAAGPSLSSARHQHTATILANGKVVVVGGLTTTSSATTVLNSLTTYNPSGTSTGTWSAVTATMSSARRAHTATLLTTTNATFNNKVLIVGGNSTTSTTTGGLTTVQLFDPAAGTFATAAALSAAREGQTATALADGTVVVAGGKSGTAAVATTQRFSFTGTTGAWASAGTLSSARLGHTATLLASSTLASGTLLVAGGNSGVSGATSGLLATAELWNGTTTWAATTALGAAVQGQTATLLSGGLVLIAGGNDGTQSVTRAATYDPSAALSCTSNSQCATGFCANGVCCDSACNGGCGACNLAGKVGTCSPIVSGTTCRGAVGPCDKDETCTGTSLTCPVDALAPATQVCRGAVNACDVAELCTGTSAVCPVDKFAPATQVCRGAVNACDVAELCTGTSAACPADAFAPATQVCRRAVNACDVAELCTGTSAACPADAFAPATQVCRGAVNACDVAELCTGTSAACPTDAFAPATQVCRGAVNACDVAELCTGTSAACPADAFAPATQVCRGAVNACDIAELCTGTSAVCPVDRFAPATQVCRGAVNACDVAELCTGTSAACPADAFAPATQVCRGAVNACDVAELCTGTSAACPADAFAPATQVCRGAVNACDVAELCTGTSAVCPVDAKKPDGASCSDGDRCTLGEICQAGSCQRGSADICAPGNSVTFYQSFDHGATVDIAGGAKTPNESDPFIPAEGLFGGAVDGSTTPWLSYHDTPTSRSISLAKPGSASFWVKIYPDYIPACFIEVQDGHTATNMYICDHGSPSGIGIEDYYADPATGAQQYIAHLSMVSPTNWAGDGQWHLVVVNWSPTTFAISVDAGPPTLFDTPWLGPDHIFYADAGSAIYLGGSDQGYAEGYAKDEMIILDRPMSTAEIQWYYAQRSTGGSMVPNPAIAYLNAAGSACTSSDDLNPCTADACDPVGGATHVKLAAGTPCSDGNVCNGAETCNQNGQCAAGTPPVVDDGNPCTADACDAIGGVTHAPVADFTGCSDGNVCNGLESCQAGVCLPEPAGAVTTCAGGTHVTFYQSFDSGTAADIAASARTPLTNNMYTQVPGLFGLAMDAATDPELNYQTTTPGTNPTNLLLSKPGSVSFWVKPGPSYVSGVFFDAYGASNSLLVADYGSNVAATLQRGAGEFIIAQANTNGPANWRTDGRWHLFVVNWSQYGLVLSIDTVSSPVASAPAMLELPAGANTTSLIFAGVPWPSGAHFAKDELMILDRPLSTADVAWYVAQGASPATVNPAIARFNGDSTSCNAMDDLNPCTTDTCTPVTGAVHALVTAGTACDDGNACSGADVCNGSGTCVAGAPLVSFCVGGIPLVNPRFDGIVDEGSGQLVAAFGYDSTSTANIMIATSSGNNSFKRNGIVDSSPAVAPPVVFLPGAQHGSFLAPIAAGDTLTWTVAGQTVTATGTAPKLAHVSMPTGGYGVMAGGQLAAVQSAVSTPTPGVWATAAFTAPFCTDPAQRQVVLADLDGDGFSDVVCHNPVTGEVWTALTRAGAAFAGPIGHYATGWCPGPNTRLYAGDLDGDGRSDLVCVDPDTGLRSAWLVDSDGTLGARLSSTTLTNDTVAAELLRYTDVGPPPPGGGPVNYPSLDSYLAQVRRSHCASAGTELFLVTLGGDPLIWSSAPSRKDVLCHDKTTGELWQLNTSVDGRIGGDVAYPQVTSPPFCGASDGDLFVAQFEHSYGLPRAQLLCHNSGNGSIKVRRCYGGPDGCGAKYLQEFPLTGTFCSNVLPFIVGPSTMLVGDFNGDEQMMAGERADLLCRHKVLDDHIYLGGNHMEHEFATAGPETIPTVSELMEPPNPTLFPFTDDRELLKRLPYFCNGGSQDLVIPNVLAGRFGNQWRDDLFCWSGSSVTIAFSNWPPAPRVALVANTPSSLTIAYAPPDHPYGSHLDYHFFVNGAQGPIVNGDVAGQLTIPGLAASTTYQVLVQASSSAESSPLVEVIGKTQPPSPEAAPSALHITTGSVRAHSAMLTFIDNTPDEGFFHYYVNGQQIGNVHIPASPGIGGMVSARIDNLYAGGTTRLAVSAATPIGETALSDEVDVTTPYDTTTPQPQGKIVIEKVAPVWAEFTSFGQNILHWSIPNEPILLQSWQGISLAMCNRSDVATTLFVSSSEEVTPLWASKVLASEGADMGHYWNFDSSENPMLESPSDAVDAMLRNKTAFNGVSTSYDTEEYYQPLVLPSTCVHFDLPWVEFPSSGTYHYKFTAVTQTGGPAEDDALVLKAYCEVGSSSPVCTFSEAYEVHKD